MVNRWLIRLTALYVLWFLCGYVLVSGGFLPGWLTWVNGFYLILGGVTALTWYTRKYGSRQAAILFVVCSSISYAAEWIGVHTRRWFGAYDYGSAFAPLVFGVPLAIPFAWCMLLIIAKAFAPASPAADAWRGLSLAEKLAPNARAIKQARARKKRRSFWLPAIWAASMVTAIDLLLDPVAVKQRYWTWVQKEAATWNLMFDAVPLSNYVCWWLTALLIMNIINYLHDEYMVRRGNREALGEFIPLLLLLTLESLFLTLAVKSGLWWAAASNVGLLALLFLWRRKEAFS